MKPETLEALLVDRQLGELPNETAELLDSYLELNPDARRHADAIGRTVGAARDAIRRFPELAEATEVATPSRIVPLTRWFAPWMMRAAVLAATIIIAGLSGYRAGIDSAPTPSTMANKASAPTFPKVHAPEPRGDLWARYHVAFDRNRGIFTVAIQP